MAAPKQTSKLSLNLLHSISLFFMAMHIFVYSAEAAQTLVIGLSTVIAGSITAVLGAPASGGFIGTMGVTGLVAVFVFSGKKETKADPPVKDTTSPQAPDNNI